MSVLTCLSFERGPSLAELKTSPESLEKAKKRKNLSSCAMSLETLSMNNRF